MCRNQQLSSLLLASWILLGAALHAQTTQTGTHYFALENLTSGVVAQRGEAGSLGVAFENLFLAPGIEYRVWILQGSTLRVGYTDFGPLRNGQRLAVPDIFLGDALSEDADADGLHAEGEFIMGTSDADPDSDDDGILDGAEVRQGSNPLDGVPGGTGIVASVDTPGEAKDVFTRNETAVLALGSRGVSVFNIFNGMQPTIVAQVDTPGDATAVALDRELVAVADGDQGLQIIDISDPPTARIVRRTILPGRALCVKTAAGFAYVGTSEGTLAVVKLDSGLVLATATLPRAVQDVALAGDHLYALTEGTLHVFPLEIDPFLPLASANSAGGTNTSHGRMRLAVGGGVAYLVHRNGYNTIDVSDPLNPVEIRNTRLPQFGWKQIVPNGSGLGVATTSPNQSFDGPHHLELFDLSDPGVTDAFLDRFETPGVARSVSIFNGIAYVADHVAGLQVVHYLAPDRQGVPPTITLASNLGFSQVEENKLMRITAEVSDDVQVRNVEFYLDGRLLATDGNFPFEFRFFTPELDLAPQFTLRARASDTGGNATWTDEIVVDLAEDATPPRVIAHSPRDGALVGNTTNAFLVVFSESMDLATLRNGAITLVNAGNDDTFDTADDVEVSDASISFEEDTATAVVERSQPFAPGTYRARIGPPAADRAGNQLAGITEFGFRVIEEIDTDGDGLFDDWENALGYDPDDPDSDGNGVVDGDEDFDADGLSNLIEIALGRAPDNPDTDGDGILDGDEDTDFDGLTDSREFALGLRYDQVDSDGDFLDDFTEVASGSDPLDATSGTGTTASGKVSFLNAVSGTVPSTLSGATATLARPASYQNAVGATLPPILPVGVASDPASYENQQP